ncbi:MAG: SDR family oxidoreductase [Candidatus Sulfotelmatobacter sp.]|jgi:NAD(P)-dependent dehydrogenase (short-subunit alcohol dehydrogenase family)
MATQKRFEGKTVVITGGNSGIGLATAKLFRQEGAKVAITGRDQETLDEAIKIIGDGTLAVKADVSKLADLDKFYAQVKAKFGKIDALFANAGIAKFAPTSDAGEQLFDETFDINVKGLYFTIQKALPLLNDNAAIVLNASVVSTKGYPGTSIYSATKAAVRSLARTFAAELVDRGIRVNVVSPGPIETPILQKGGLPQAAFDQYSAGIKERVPMKRFGTPEEIAYPVLFLASSEASYITGVDLNVDGGTGQL